MAAVRFPHQPKVHPSRIPAKWEGGATRKVCRAEQNQAGIIPKRLTRAETDCKQLHLNGRRQYQLGLTDIPRTRRSHCAAVNGNHTQQGGCKLQA